MLHCHGPEKNIQSCKEKKNSERLHSPTLFNCPKYVMLAISVKCQTFILKLCCCHSKLSLIWVLDMKEY